MKSFTLPKLLSCLLIWSLPVVVLAGSGTLSNPLASVTMQDFLIAIVGVVQIIAVPILVFFIIYAGFLYTTARGNPETIQRASKALVYAIIGGVVVAGAQAIITIVENTANSF